MAWGTPIYRPTSPTAPAYNAQLRAMILEAEATDPDAALFGGINAVKSSQALLRWDDPAIAWIRDRIGDAVTALTQAELGDAAREVTQRHPGRGMGRGLPQRRQPAPAHPPRLGMERRLLRRSRRHQRQHATPATCNCWTPARPPSPSRPPAAPSGSARSPAAWSPSPAGSRTRSRPPPTATAQRICIAWNVAYDKTWSAMS